jgi:hypothetical protein
MSEEQIRTLAFYLWEQDGSPDGRANEYWEKARRQLGLENTSPDTTRTADTASGEAPGFGDEPEETATRPLTE